MIGFYNYTVVLTYLGFVSGTSGVFLAASHHPFYATICLLVSGFCDMFDGKIARTRVRTRQETRFGVQIDSLSDLVCFGVLPAAIGFAVGMRRWYWYFVIVFYVLTAMIRLAYFNVLEEDRMETETLPRKSYLGLPVTCAALIFPLLWAVMPPPQDFRYFYFIYAAVMTATAVLFVSPIKVKKLDFKWMMGVSVLGLIVLAALLFKRFLI